MREQFDTRRKAEDVFDYITDFSRISEWDHTIIGASKVSNGAIGLASKFDLVFKMGPRKSEIMYEITEFEHPRRAVLTGTSKNFIAVDTVSIAETDSGCSVDWHAQIEFNGASGSIVKLLESRIKAGGAKTIADLKVALDDNFDPPKLGTMAKLGDMFIVPGLLSFSKFGYSSNQKNWNPVTASVKGKHAVITGATSGLGLATAQQLAHLGAHLTLVARNEAKANQVAKEIEERTGNQNIKIEITELSEMQEVAELAGRLIKQDRAIDILINNAGALMNPRQETSEGLEKSFALLLLGPYLLTEKLKPLLAKGASANGAARVINVSSGGMYATRLSIKNLQSTKGKYSGADAYARAKRGLVIMGETWADEWAADGITVHNMHPGWARTPGVINGIPSFERSTRPILRTAEQGADTIIWLATATEAAKTSGLFWLDRLPHSTHLTSRTKESAGQRVQLKQNLDSYIEDLT